MQNNLVQKKLELQKKVRESLKLLDKSGNILRDFGREAEALAMIDKSKELIRSSLEFDYSEFFELGTQSFVVIQDGKPVEDNTFVKAICKLCGADLFRLQRLKLQQDREEVQTKLRYHIHKNWCDGNHYEDQEEPINA